MSNSAYRASRHRPQSAAARVDLDKITTSGDSASRWSMRGQVSTDPVHVGGDLSGRPALPPRGSRETCFGGQARRGGAGATSGIGPQHEDVPGLGESEGRDPANLANDRSAFQGSVGKEVRMRPKSASCSMGRTTPASLSPYKGALGPGTCRVRRPPSSGRGSSPHGILASFRRRSRPVSATAIPAASSSKAAASPKRESAAERRRRKAVEFAAVRATKIAFCLETKFGLLPDVCSSIENWKGAPSASSDFDLLWWDMAIPSDRFMELKLYQKMNHFVGMGAITRKDNLGRNLRSMRKQFPREYKFFPDTWMLPTDLPDFKMQFSSSKKKTFILKPDNAAEGKGIFLVRDVEMVPSCISTTCVAQRYIHPPFLLDGFKCDFRLYVLVLGCDPLRIFLHRRGLVRLASEPYVEPSGKNIQQAMIHLTNYSLNRVNPNFKENLNPEDARDGHKRSWEAVQEQLRKDGHDVVTLMAEIEDLIIKTLLAVQPSLSHLYHSCQPEDLENSMCFEILGFDVMLDQQMQPWLLEVNHAPSFNTSSELDKVVKTEVLQDTFALLNLCPENRKQKKREARERMEQRALGVATRPSTQKRTALKQAIARQRTVWEDEHLNGYKRLYPSEQHEREYRPIHDAAIDSYSMSSRRSVYL